MDMLIAFLVCRPYSAAMAFVIWSIALGMLYSSAESAADPDDDDATYSALRHHP